jgi:hypothetical protein
MLHDLSNSPIQTRNPLAKPLIKNSGMKPNSTNKSIDAQIAELEREQQNTNKNVDAQIAEFEREQRNIKEMIKNLTVEEINEEIRKLVEQNTSIENKYLAALLEEDYRRNPAEEMQNNSPNNSINQNAGLKNNRTAMNGGRAKRSKKSFRSRRKTRKNYKAKH